MQQCGFQKLWKILLFTKKNFLRIGDFEKWPCWKSVILNFFFQKKIFFFAFFPWKLVKVYWLARMAQNFDQAKWPMPNILKGSVFWEGHKNLVQYTLFFVAFSEYLNFIFISIVLVGIYRIFAWRDSRLKILQSASLYIVTW